MPQLEKPLIDSPIQRSEGWQPRNELNVIGDRAAAGNRTDATFVLPLRLTEHGRRFEEAPLGIERGERNIVVIDRNETQ